MERIAITVVLMFALAPLGLAGPADKVVDDILKDYFKIQSVLAQDTIDGVDSAARAIHHTAASANASDPEVQRILKEIETAAHTIQGQDLNAARDTFFEMSKPLLVYLNKFHSNKGEYSRYFCPMAKKGWVQADSNTRNPYHGSSMLSCGELIE